MSRTMVLCLALAPHLATLTYASPYLIVLHSVAGAVVKLLKIQPPIPTPQTDLRYLAKPSDEDAWRVVPATDDATLADAEISDARLCAHTARTARTGHIS